MTLGEHFAELRSRVVKSAAAITVMTVVAFVFHRTIFTFLTSPYCDLKISHQTLGSDRCSLVVSGVMDAFTVSLRISLYAGLVLSAPVWLWQLWRYITPGLRQNERKWALSFTGASLVLFAAGGALAYVTMSKGLGFLLSFASGGLTPLVRVDSYLNYMLSMIVVFAVAFELPMLLTLLNLAGILSYERLLHSWRTAIFLVFLFAALATPSQDPFTMSAMALPMCALFGLALLIARVHDARVARRQPDEMFADLADDEISSLEMDTV